MNFYSNFLAFIIKICPKYERNMEIPNNNNYNQKAPFLRLPLEYCSLLFFVLLFAIMWRL
ncbi:hypothetical protein K502DRAFT_56170 [Neoconidiobolus thromboides FSU 785]|nr:hypothetical protein K502DRAFT_56170 [Neoconidiobolus thromboides FSU 785]